MVANYKCDRTDVSYPTQGSSIYIRVGLGTVYLGFLLNFFLSKWATDLQYTLYLGKIWKKWEKRGNKNEVLKSSWCGCQSNFSVLGPWSLRRVITCVAPSIHANHRETHGHEGRKHIIGWARVIKEIEDYAASLIVVHAYSCLTLEPMCLLPCKGNESVVMVW